MRRLYLITPDGQVSEPEYGTPTEEGLPHVEVLRKLVGGHPAVVTVVWPVNGKTMPLYAFVKEDQARLRPNKLASAHSTEPLDLCGNMVVLVLDDSLPLSDHSDLH